MLVLRTTVINFPRLKYLVLHQAVAVTDSFIAGWETKVFPSAKQQVFFGLCMKKARECTVYTRVQVERVYKSNPIFEAKNTTFLEKG